MIVYFVVGGVASINSLTLISKDFKIVLYFLYVNKEIEPTTRFTLYFKFYMWQVWIASS